MLHCYCNATLPSRSAMVPPHLLCDVQWYGGSLIERGGVAIGMSRKIDVVLGMLFECRVLLYLRA